jgi:hypothetical protein
VTLRAIVETGGSFLGHASITKTVRYTVMSRTSGVDFNRQPPHHLPC